MSEVPVRSVGLPSPTPAVVVGLGIGAALAFPWGLSVAGIVMAVVVAAWIADLLFLLHAPLVERTFPGEAARGAASAMVVRVAARPGIRVWVRQPQTAEVRIEPAEARSGLDGRMVALTRGAHALPPSFVRSTGPLGLARRLHSAGGTTTIHSHADLPGARRLAIAVRRGQFKEVGMRRGPLGLGTDFETIREYTPDDDIRRMNWLASERAGRPMVNQYREDTDRELWCLVDAGRLSSSPVGDRTRLDVTLDAVAAVAAVADVVGDRVGAVVFDDAVRRTVRPRRANAAGLVRLLDDLEPRPVDSDYDAAFAQVATAKRGLVVLFTDILDEAASRPLLEAIGVLARRHAVVVAGVRDPDLVDLVTTVPSDRRDLLAAGVATELLAERDRVRARLTAGGAVVVDGAVDRLPTTCVAAYLRLKSVARL